MFTYQMRSLCNALFIYVIFAATEGFGECWSSWARRSFTTFTGERTRSQSVDRQTSVWTRYRDAHTSHWGI